MPSDLPPDPEAPASHDAELTDEELKALAHPLRVRMFEALVLDGPATATQLAERFGESSGATSYHLRQLARQGFIEDDPDRGNARDRWWKAARRGWTLPAFDFHRRPETRDHAAVLLHELARGRLERLTTWFETFHRWGEEWVEASTDADARLRLTRDELANLTEDLREVYDRYVELDGSREDPPEAALISLQVYAFPVEGPDEPPAGADQDASAADPTG